MASASDRFKVPDDFPKRLAGESKELLEAREDWKTTMENARSAICRAEKNLEEVIAEHTANVAKAADRVRETRGELVESIEDDLMIPNTTAMPATPTAPV